MTQLSEQTKFAYAVARIRALEHLLIDRTTMMRLLDEPLPGVCRILEEKGYPPAGDYCGSIPESGDEAFISPAFSKLKDTLLARTFSELKKLGENSPVTKLLPLRYDCLNLAWIMKAQLTGEPVPRLFHCGTISPDKLKYLAADEDKGFEGLLRNIYRESVTLIDEGRSPRLIGCRAIALYWRHFLNVARNSGLSFLKELAVINIDGINLSSFARLKVSDSAQLSALIEEMVPAVAQAGDVMPDMWKPTSSRPLPVSWYRKQWGEPVESLTANLSGTRYEGVVTVATSAEGCYTLAFDR